MMFNKKVIIAIALCVVLGIWSLWAEASGLFSARPHFEYTSIHIVRSDGKELSFSVEVAKTHEQQMYGLMFVRSLPDNEGMIFPDSPPRKVTFWMKNTLIPLDMLFVGPDHKIAQIVANAVPEDMTPINSDGIVCAVIELKGGAAKQNGLAVGDNVSSDALPPEQ